MILSIIIAAYNAEPYLEKNLLEISKLKDLEFEVIVINDGSSDNTFLLLESLSTQYSWLKVISQPNAGVSVARNRGIEEASGEWLMFVDADDWINPGNLQQLLNRIRNTKSHVVTFGATFIYTNKNEVHAVTDKIYTTKDFINGADFQLASWNYLFRSSIIREKNICFPESIICMEDQNFNLKAIVCSANVQSVNLNVYNYNQTNVNSASKKHHSIKWIESRLLALNDLLDFCVRKHIDTGILINQAKRFLEAFMNDDTTDISMMKRSILFRREYSYAINKIPSLKQIKKFPICYHCMPIGYILFKMNKLLKA